MGFTMSTLQQIKTQIEQTTGVLSVAQKHNDTHGNVKLYSLTITESVGSLARTSQVRYAVSDEGTPDEQALPIGASWQPYQEPTPDDLSQPVRDYLASTQGLPNLYAYSIVYLDLDRREAIVAGVEVIDSTTAERREYLIWKPDGQPIQRRRIT